MGIRSIFQVFGITILLIIGCKGGGPIQPPLSGDEILPLGTAQNPQGMQAQESVSQRVLIGAYRVEVDRETRTVNIIPIRDIEIHWNVTAFLRPPYCPDCFRVEVIKVEEPIWTLLAIIKNPSKQTVYDVRATITSTGHFTLTSEPDSYTELFAPPGDPNPRNPFFIFDSHIGKNQWLPQTVGTCQVSFAFPIGYPITEIKLVIDASWPGNQSDPTKITDLELSAPVLFPDGSNSSMITCSVHDWQDDVTEVTADLSPLGGNSSVPLQKLQDGTYLLENIKVISCEPGDKTIWVKAVSNGENIYQCVPCTVKGPDDWTIMVYLRQEDLPAEGDIYEMEESGSLPNELNILVLWDKPNVSDKDILLRIDHGSSTVIDDKGLIPTDGLDMADGATLRAFLYFAMGYYPANHYMLVLWDHGNGIWHAPPPELPFKDVCMGLTLWAIRDACNEALLRFKTVDKLDIVGFDACLMGWIETAFCLRDVTDIVISSQNNIPITGWDYGPPLINLRNNIHSQTATQLAHDIVTSYIAAYWWQAGITLNASKTENLLNIKDTELKTFVAACIDALPTYLADFQSCADASRWDPDNNPDINDIGRFAHKVSQHAAFPNDVKQTATALENAIHAAMIVPNEQAYTFDVPDNASGWKIWLPDNISTESENHLQQYLYPDFLEFYLTEWDEFLFAYAESGFPTCNPDDNNNWNDPGVPGLGYDQSTGLQTVCNPDDRVDWYKFTNNGILHGVIDILLLSEAGSICDMTLYDETQLATYPNCANYGWVEVKEPVYTAQIDVEGLSIGPGNYYIRVRHAADDYLVRQYRVVNNTYEGSLGPTFVTQNITTYTEWRPHYSPYVIQSNDISITATGHLKILPGVVVKLMGRSINVDGILEAEGMSGNEIIFTSVKDDAADGVDVGNDGPTVPNKGDWYRIYFKDSSVDTSCILRHCEVRFGGYGSSASADKGMIWCEKSSPTIDHCKIEYSHRTGVYVTTGSPSISNCQIGYCTHYGLRFNGGSASVISDTQAYCNSICPIGYDLDSYPDWQISNSHWGNTYEGRGLFGTMNVSERVLSITEQAVLPYLVVSDPVISSNLTIAASKKLVIEPGVVIKFTGNSRSIEVNGILQCIGLAMNKIVFTSVKDDAADNIDVGNDGPTLPNRGDWPFICFRDSSIDSTCVLRYCDLRYGGYGNQGMVFCDKSSPRIEFCRLEYSGGIGIHAVTASPPIKNCRIGDCNQYGIRCASGSSPVISDTAVYGCNLSPIGYDLISYPDWQLNNTHWNNKYEGRGLWGAMSVIQRQLTVAEQAILPFVIVDDPIYSPNMLSINEGCKLVLAPGITFKLAPNIGIEVNGALRCEGLADNKIKFTSVKDDLADGIDIGNDGPTPPAKGDWTNIYFKDKSVDAECLLKHCEIKFGGYNGSTSSRRMIWSEIASPTIDHCLIENSQGVGIYVNTGSSHVTNCEIGFNGGDGIQCNNGGNIIINDSQVYNNGGCPLAYDLLSFPNWDASNTNWGNKYEGRGLYGSVAFPERYLTVAEQSILPYVIVGNIQIGSVSSSPKLGVDQGVVLKFAPYYSIDVYGVLDCEGSSISPIIFTSVKDDTADGIDVGNDGVTAPAKGDWNYIRFQDNSIDSLCALKYCEIRYGGYSSSYPYIICCDKSSPKIDHCGIEYSKYHGIYLNNGSPQITNCRIDYNSQEGIECVSSSQPTIGNCQVHDNLAAPISYDLLSSPDWQASNTHWGNKYEARGIFGNVAFPNRHLIASEQIIMPYLVIGDIQIGSISDSPILVIEPGIVIKFADRNYGIDVYGTLDCSGLEGNEVIFTSIKDDNADGIDLGKDGITTPAKGDWDCIQFLDNSVDAACSLQHCKIRYGGYNNSCLIKCVSAAPAIEYCRLEYSYNGIDITSGAPPIQFCNIGYNTLNGVKCGSGCASLIDQCNIYNNTQCGIWISKTASPELGDNEYSGNGSDICNE